MRFWTHTIQTILTLICIFVIIDFDECGHWHFVHFVGVGCGLANLTPPAPIRGLPIAADNAFATVHTNIDGAAELNVGRFWELERAEFGRQQVTVYGVEILKQVRVDGATVGKYFF